MLTRLVRRLVRRGDLTCLAKLADALPRHHPGRPIIAFALGIAGKTIDASAMLARIEVSAVREDSPRAGPRTITTTPTMRRRAYCSMPATSSRCMVATARDCVPFRTRDAGGRADAGCAYHSFSARDDVAARAFSLARVLAGEPGEFTDFVVRPPQPESEQSAPQTGMKRRRTKRVSRHSGRERYDREQDRAKAKELFEPILALHAVRSRILAGEITPDDAPARLTAAVATLGASRRYQDRQHEWRPHDDEAVRAF